MARSRATRNEMRDHNHVEHPSVMPRKSKMRGGAVQEHEEKLQKAPQLKNSPMRKSVNH